MSSHPGSDHMRYRMVLLFILLAFCIVSAGALYYSAQKETLKKNIQNELSAIADLKVDQITTWRKERIGNATVISKNTFIAGVVRNFLENPEAPELRQELLDWMMSRAETYGYKSVYLVDVRGIIRLSTIQSDRTLGPQAKKMLLEAMNTKHAVLSDIYSKPSSTDLHIDLVGPFFMRKGNFDVPIGAIVFNIDPHSHLYPLIQSWQGQSDTSETLLVRREGDEIIYLNELRHRKGTAFIMRLPLDTKQLPAARAIRGERGVFEGIDYRKVPVLAAVRAVPQTTWFLIAKMDLTEMYTPIRKQARQVAIVIILLIAATSLGIFFWWRRKISEYARKQYEAELASKVLSQRYDYLSKYANDIILLIDPDGHIVEANDRAIAAYGYSRDELLRLSIRDIRSPETHHAIKEQMRQVREQKGMIFETVHRNKDGTAFPVEVSSRVIDIDGKSFYQSVIRDITERKKSEIALINEKNKSQAIIAAIGDGISVQDREFRIIYQNQVDKDLHGDHIGELCYEAYEYQDKTCEGCALAESFKDGTIHTTERSVQTDHGPLHVEITASPLKNESGEIIAGIEVVRNITARKQMERSLIESEQRYKRLVRSVTDYIVTIDVEDGRVVATHHGPGCVNVTGYTTNEYQADPNLWYRMVFDGDRDVVIEQSNSVLSGAPAAPFEHRIIHKDGSLRWVRHTPVPRTDGSGRLITVDSLITDITQLKLLESQLRQAQKMEAVGQLAGGVAHDFNNILTAIIGYSHILLLKIEAGNPNRPYVEQIISASERAAHLTRSLLAFSRTQVVDLKPVNLNDIIRRMDHLLGRVIGEDIEFKSMLAENVLPVLADSMHIEQVLMNLAANARDAMPNGGLLRMETEAFAMEEGFIRAHSYGKPGTYACLSITDTGIGMDENTRSRIFEPFFTTKEVGKGTGLGLSMVYGIIKQHNGYINVYSEPGKGTTFRIYLPLTVDETSVDKPSPVPAEIARGTETVLIAEDDKTVRDLARYVLEDSGYHVLEAADGEAAVQTFLENRKLIDLVIFDVIMPKKNGKEAYWEIKEICPDIKALFMSGYTSDKVNKKGTLEEAGLDFVMKPISPSDFLKKVREILDRT